MGAATPGRTVVSRDIVEAPLVSALHTVPPSVPVLVGGCGSGRTTTLYSLRRRLGASACQYIDVERTATTPERFLRALVEGSPFAMQETVRTVRTAREAYDRTLAFLATAKSGASDPATFLLDEFLELRTFASFPGLRHAVDELLRVLATSGNRFVLTSRYASRAARLLRVADRPFVRVEAVPFAVSDVRAVLEEVGRENPGPVPPERFEADADEFSRIIHLLSGGQPACVRAICEAMGIQRQRGSGDPVSALAATLAPDGPLAERCLRSYEIRLHRARGYGALKAILDILAEEEPLTLTEIARRLRRTPGSTKDYLSWLEDVDLVVCGEKRYVFSSPILRLWVRLYCRPLPPTDDVVAHEIQQFVFDRLSQSLSGAAEAAGGAGRRQRTVKPAPSAQP